MSGSKRWPGALIDTNLLLVLFVGSWNSDRVGKAKGLREFATADYELLAGIVARAKPLVVTPHILTEADNLLSRLGEADCQECRRWLATWLGRHLSPGKGKESQPPTLDVVSDPLFPHLGLADAAIARVALTRRCVVWTNDEPLHRSLALRKVPSRFWREVRTAWQ